MKVDVVMFCAIHCQKGSGDLFWQKICSLIQGPTTLSPNFSHVFFYSPKERKKRDAPPPLLRKVRTKIQWEYTLSPMSRQRSLRSSGALRGTRTLFPTYQTTCGSTFLGYWDWNHHERFSNTKASLRVFLWAQHMRKVGINEIMFTRDVVAACRLWLICHIKLSLALGATIMAGSRSQAAVRGTVEHVRVHDSGGSAWIN